MITHSPSWVCVWHMFLKVADSKQTHNWYMMLPLSVESKYRPRQTGTGYFGPRRRHLISPFLPLLRVCLLYYLDVLAKGPPSCKQTRNNTHLRHRVYSAVSYIRMKTRLQGYIKYSLPGQLFVLVPLPSSGLQSCCLGSVLLGPAQHQQTNTACWTYRLFRYTVSHRSANHKRGRRDVNGWAGQIDCHACPQHSESTFYLQIKWWMLHRNTPGKNVQSMETQIKKIYVKLLLDVLHVWYMGHSRTITI